MSELGSPSDNEPSDSFATIADVPVQSDSNRTPPNQIPSGVGRGTQKIVNLDGSYVTFGVIPDNSGDIGVAFFNPSGQLISKNVGKTQYFYNPTTNKIIAQLGTQGNGDSALKFFDTNGIGLAQFGNFSSGSFALKVAKANIEVATATNDQLIFNSGQDIFKIVSNGMLTTTIGADSTASTNKTTTQTVAHGLSFTPIVVAFMADPTFGTYTPLPFFKSRGTLQRNFSSPNNGIVLALNQYIWGSADATNVYFRNDFANDLFPGTYSTSATVINYYLLQETAT